MPIFVAYSLFFVVTNGVIFVFLNNNIQISKAITLGYGVILATVLFTSVSFTWAMPIKQLFNNLILSFLGLTSFYYYGKYQIAKMETTKRLTEDLKPMAYRLISLVFQKLPFILVSILQGMVAINFAF